MERKKGHKRYSPAIIRSNRPHRTILSYPKRNTEDAMIKTIKSYLSLEKIGYAFSDSVSGKAVNYYRDCYGKVWLKDSRWGLFRVLSKTE